MSQPVPESPLPANIHYGYVVGRLVNRVGDTSNDEDILPGDVGITAKGSVTIISLDGISVESSTDPQMIVLPQPVVCDLVDGYISLNGSQKIALWEGSYRVNFSSATGMSKTINFTLTADSTIDNPLQLASKLDADAPSNVTITTVKIASTAQPGQALVLDTLGTTLQGIPVVQMLADPTDPGVVDLMSSTNLSPDVASIVLWTEA